MWAPTDRGSADRRAHEPGQAGSRLGCPPHSLSTCTGSWGIAVNKSPAHSTLAGLYHTIVVGLRRSLAQHPEDAGAAQPRACSPSAPGGEDTGPGAPLLRTWHPSLPPAAEKCCGPSSVSRTCSLLP